jgi:hypothetical protein
MANNCQSDEGRLKMSLSVTPSDWKPIVFCFCDFDLTCPFEDRGERDLSLETSVTGLNLVSIRSSVRMGS